MKPRFDKQMNRIREGWSQEEREHRKQLAGAMQLQLRQIVVLRELTAQNQDKSERQLEMASAC